MNDDLRRTVLHLRYRTLADRSHHEHLLCRVGCAGVRLRLVERVDGVGLAVLLEADVEPGELAVGRFGAQLELGPGADEFIGLLELESRTGHAAGPEPGAATDEHSHD